MFFQKKKSVSLETYVYAQQCKIQVPLLFFIIHSKLLSIFKACGGLAGRKDIKIREKGYTLWVNSMWHFTESVRYKVIRSCVT